MKNKSILLVSINSLHFVQEYISNVLANTEYEIHFLTVKADLSDNIWKESNVIVHTLRKNNENKFKALLLFPLRLLSIRIKLNKIDVLHYHYIDYKFTHIFDYYFHRMAKKTILTFWGSDLFRQTNKNILSFRRLYKKSYKINMMNQEMLDKFNEVTQQEFSNKLEIVDFGDSTLEKITNIKKAVKKNIIKNQWNLPSEKIIVHVGYNGIKAQQHLQLLNALNKCNSTVKNSIFLIVPFSYGCDDENYRNQVLKTLKNTNIPYILLEDFISQDEIASFRLTADIFLYGQSTDACSASMIEYFASDCVVVKPKWLIYSELSDNGISMIEYNDFDELTTLFQKMLKTDLSKTIEFNKNQNIVYKLKSWKYLSQKWLDLYI